MPPPAPLDSNLELVDLPLFLSQCAHSRELWLEHQDTLLLLSAFEPERWRSQLQALLPARHGGKPVRDSVLVWRSLFLAMCVEQGRINSWVARLKREPFWCFWLGLKPEEAPPSVGTHYRWLERLERGPRSPVEGLHGQHGRFMRALNKEKQARQAQNEDELILSRAQQMQLRHQSQAPLRQDLNARLVEMVVEFGLKPLCEQGGLDNQGKLAMGVDGTVCRSHARARGISNAQHDHKNDKDEDEQEGKEGKEGKESKEGKGPRAYSDPEATWRWSNANKALNFGHLLVGATLKLEGYDLPLFSVVAQPHQGEIDATMHGLEHFQRVMQAQGLARPAKWLLADAGYDAAGFYQLSRLYGYSPLIARNKRYGVPTDEHVRDEHGIPLCDAGQIPMRLHERDELRQIYRCPAVKNIKQVQDNGSRKSTWTFCSEHCPLGEPCQPERKLGPSKVVYHQDHPRLNPELPYGSAAYKEVYAQRTCVERTFSQFHHHIPHRRFRRARLWALAGAMQTLRMQRRYWLEHTQAGRDYKAQFIEWLKMPD